MNNNQIQFKCVFRYSLVQCLYYYCGAHFDDCTKDVLKELHVQEEEMSDSDEDSAEVDDK